MSCILGLREVLGAEYNSMTDAPLVNRGADYRHRLSLLCSKDSRTVALGVRTSQGCPWVSYSRAATQLTMLVKGSQPYSGWAECMKIPIHSLI